MLTRAHRGATLLIAGCLVYLAVHVGFLQITALADRRLPIEPDDAYSYILTAPQWLECREGCRALDDLRTQVATTGDTASPAFWTRARQHNRLFVQYHPGHTALLLVLNRVAGVPWERAYNLVWVAGAVGVAIAMALWLWRLVGAGGAGIALLILAAGHFQEQGLDAIAPSTMSMGLAMLAWAVVLSDDRRHHV